MLRMNRDPKIKYVNNEITRFGLYPYYETISRLISQERHANNSGRTETYIIEIPTLDCISWVMMTSRLKYNSRKCPEVLQGNKWLECELLERVWYSTTDNGRSKFAKSKYGYCKALDVMKADHRSMTIDLIVQSWIIYMCLYLSDHRPCGTVL
jgi:hypothetical protein